MEDGIIKKERTKTRTGTRKRKREREMEATIHLFRESRVTRFDEISPLWLKW